MVIHILLSNFFCKIPWFYLNIRKRTFQIIMQYMCIKKCRLSKNDPNIKKVLQYSHINVLVFLYVYCTLKMILISFEIATHQKSKLQLDCNTLENQTLIQAHGICHFCLFICITCISKESQNIKLALAMNTGKNETLSTI